MEYIYVPSDVAELLEKDPFLITKFTEAFGLLDVKLNRGNMSVIGDRESVEKARKFAPAHFLALKKRLCSLSTISVVLPKCMVDVMHHEEIMTIIENEHVQVNLNKGIVKLFGELQYLKDAEMKLKHYFNAFQECSVESKPKSDPPKRKLKEDGVESQSKATRHLHHECFYCSASYSSKYFRRHVKSCDKGLGRYCSLDEKENLVDLFYKKD